MHVRDFIVVAALTASIPGLASGGRDRAQVRTHVGDTDSLTQFHTIVVRVVVVDTETWKPVRGARLQLCERAIEGPAQSPVFASVRQSRQLQEILPAAVTNAEGQAFFIFHDARSDGSSVALRQSYPMEQADFCACPLEIAGRVESISVRHPDYRSDEIPLHNWLDETARRLDNVKFPDPASTETDRSLDGGRVERHLELVYLLDEIPIEPEPRHTETRTLSLTVRVREFAAPALPNAGQTTRTNGLSHPAQPSRAGAAGSTGASSQVGPSGTSGAFAIGPNGAAQQPTQSDPLGMTVAKLTAKQASQLWSLPEQKARTVSYGGLIVTAVEPDSPAARAGVEPGYVFFSMLVPQEESPAQSPGESSPTAVHTFFNSEAEYRHKVDQRSFGPTDRVVMWGFGFPQGYQYSHGDDLGRYRNRLELGFDTEPSLSAKESAPNVASGQPLTANDRGRSRGQVAPTQTQAAHATTRSGTVTGLPRRFSASQASSSGSAQTGFDPARQPASSILSEPPGTPGSPVSDPTARSNTPWRADTATNPSRSTDTMGAGLTGSSRGTRADPVWETPLEGSGTGAIRGLGSRDQRSGSGRFATTDLGGSLFPAAFAETSSGRTISPTGAGQAWAEDNFAGERSIDLGGAQMEFVFIPRGQFKRGSPDNERGRESDEGPARLVRILQPFYMSKSEVTQQQYVAIMGNNPSSFKGDERPVENVNWGEAAEFCRRLSARFKRPFRLPTEAEWEHACRAGSQTRYSYGEDPDCAELEDYAWYFNNSFGRTHPVGLKKPNGYGLYDMQGNVLEWCADRYDARYYRTSPSASPTGPLDGARRVVRGGSWNSSWKNCRSAARHAYEPRFSDCRLGFRIVSESAQE